MRTVQIVMQQRPDGVWYVPSDGVGHRQMPGGSDGLMACARWIRHRAIGMSDGPLCPDCFPP